MAEASDDHQKHLYITRTSPRRGENDPLFAVS